MRGDIRPLRIAQVAPLARAVPPPKYGGTERVVANITEELVRMGHDVSLYASGDSCTSARLIPGCERALGPNVTPRDFIAPHVSMLEMLSERQDEYDVVHFHLDFLHYPLARRMATPSLTTFHFRLDTPHARELHQRVNDLAFVSLSQAHREPLPGLRWLGTVGNGIPRDLFHLEEHPDPEAIAFVGRFSPDKGAPQAIRIAEKAGKHLLLAGKADDEERAHFEADIRPLLDRGHVEFVGEVDDAGKQQLLGRASAFLFPLQWPEPFGLVVIEAMACGTPTVAFDRGAMRELIEDGVTGFVVRNETEAVAALHEVGRLDRRLIRRRFEERFTSERMAREYVRLYRSLLTHPVPAFRASSLAFA